MAYDETPSHPLLQERMAECVQQLKEFVQDPLGARKIEALSIENNALKAELEKMEEDLEMQRAVEMKKAVGTATLGLFVGVLVATLVAK